MRFTRMVEKKGMPVVLLLLGIAIGLFIAGHWVPNVSAVPRQDYESLEAFTNILSIVKKNYVEEVETKNLVNGAINGMLNGLDPHSAYLTPDLYKELQMDTQGRFGGLGIEITVKGGILTVVSPIEDTPAAKAGIKPGDQIFKIEEEFTKDMTMVDAVKKMRGPKGTKITISIKREGVAELMDFTLMRDTIRVQSVWRKATVTSASPNFKSAAIATSSGRWKRWPPKKAASKGWFSTCAIIPAAC
ncbi:MAG: ctpA-2 [Deltaproteobacteria bacterium]|nr:ctpA-2 [Deltaproteobacteria bacterium]